MYGWRISSGVLPIVLRVFQNIYQSWNSNISKYNWTMSQLLFYWFQRCRVATRYFSTTTKMIELSLRLYTYKIIYRIFIIWNFCECSWVFTFRMNTWHIKSANKQKMNQVTDIVGEIVQIVDFWPCTLDTHLKEGHHDHGCMVVGFTTTCAISAYHH